MTRKFECPTCKINLSTPVSGFEFAYLLRCTNCHLVFDYRQPSIEELSRHYMMYSYATLKKCPDATIHSFRRLLSKFEIYRQKNLILDIGCGQGDFLIEANKHGWRSYGTEYSSAALELCKARGLTVFREPIYLGKFAELKFDIITSFEVIEHIQNQRSLFEIAQKLLRPGGILYITTPNFNALLRYLEKEEFKMICYPEHLCFYTRRSLRHLAEQYQFRPLKIATTGLDPIRLRAQLSRLIHRKRKYTEPFRYYNSGIDSFRDRVESNKVLSFAKILANNLLTWTGTGDTLKGWFIKV